MKQKTTTAALIALAILGLGLAATTPVAASSHREAPFITENPKVDATDFYMFRSYEPGREGYVTLIANYLPLQDAYGGPNYFALDPEANYVINIDNSGDGRPDLEFRFSFDNNLQDIKIPVGGENVSIPLINAGQIFSGDAGSLANLNLIESYRVQLKRSGGASGPLRIAGDGGSRFIKPTDNVGRKSFPDYAAYANQFLYDVEIPGCANGRLFAGQRKDPFAVNLGEIFDLVNIANPIGSDRAEKDDLADANVTSLILEVPVACVKGGGDVIGAWTTAELPKRTVLRNKPSFDNPTNTSNSMRQVSRLGMPLVNEVVIGLKDKDRFNASEPKDDLQFATYVTNPVLPELLELLFGAAGVRAPNNFPRQDLLATFVTGIDGLNKFGFGEMLRLNTAIPPTSRASQSNLGVIGGDNAGFPNGRRPGDDVVDIELRVAMGLLCHAFPGAFCDPSDAPSGTLAFTDGVRQKSNQFSRNFPYLTTPIPGSPN